MEKTPATPMTPESALNRMGYRRMYANGERVWLKPVGSVLFASNGVWWRNFFKGMTGKILLWKEETFNPVYPPLDELKTWEAYTRINICAHIRTEFEFEETP